MEKRKIKINQVEKEVSLLGFGCMRFPMKDGEVDFDLSKKMIDYAISNGVNYIDTAWPYHGGKSEELVREMLKDYDRESYYLADKLPLWECETKEDILRIFNEQLNRCGVEYFDFYLIHAVNKSRYEKAKKLDVLNILENLKKEGKIRNIGFSFHDDLDSFKVWADLYDWDFCQIQLNYMDIEHQQGYEGYEILTKKNIPVIIMEPVKGGSLANFNEEINGILKGYNNDRSIASWAFRWVASLPNVRVILSGMSDLDQVKDNIHTFTNFEVLNDEEQKIVKEVREKILDLSKVECTSCNYCMPCPYGVDIPRNFRVFNGHSMYQNTGYVKWVYKNMVESGVSADKCVECGECLPKCPQFIEIPTQLDNFQKYLKENNIIE